MEQLKANNITHIISIHDNARRGGQEVSHSVFIYFKCACKFNYINSKDMDKKLQEKFSSSLTSLFPDLLFSLSTIPTIFPFIY